MIPTLLFALMMPFLQGSPLRALTPEQKVLASHEISLEKRYPVESVNTVFKDNMLLTLEYATGTKTTTSPDWREVEKPAEYRLELKKGETFAFHDDILPEYQGKVTKTTNAHFNSAEGFASDGYLIGDGVCHLASLMYWVAKDAGLDTYAPTRHDFAPVPEIPREYGTAIYTDQSGKSYGDEMQNLYITNNKDQTITLDFKYDGANLTMDIEE